jgi:signal transduction histidine kinase
VSGKIAKVRDMTNDVSRIAPGSRRIFHFPWRYLRIAGFMTTLYMFVFFAMMPARGKPLETRMTEMIGLSLLFGVLITLIFAIIEYRMMRRLGLPLLNGEGVPKPSQRRELTLPISREEAARRVVAALDAPGISLIKSDAASGIYEATTEQTWKSYGETLTVRLEGSQPVSIAITSRPSVRLMGKLIDYGKNWENVETVQARLVGDTSTRHAPVSKAAFGSGNPPRFLEAGRVWRLIPIGGFYLLGAWQIVQRAVLLPPDAVLAGSLLFTLPALGFILEAWAFLRFRLVIKTGERTTAQVRAEAMLTNFFPTLFALGVMLRPELPWRSTENLVAVAFCGFFASLAARRAMEINRERVRGAALAVEREKADLQRQLAEAKLAALSAQIEPHFLFNTLASIQYLTRHDAEKAHAMVSDLIRYLRLALPRMKQSTARLADELDLVRAYLSIMRIRMGERLQFRIDDPGVLGNHAVPTMVLITLTENAIKHGLERKPEGGEIVISVAAEEGRLRLTVADTGGGFTTATSGTGIGLTNIRERLKTLYAADGVLELAPNEPTGVVATVTIPLENM